MDAVEWFITIVAICLWMVCGLIAYSSFLADIHQVILGAAGSDERAMYHYNKWKTERRLKYVTVFFAITGIFALLVMIVATRGFRSGFRYS